MPKAKQKQRRRKFNYNINRKKLNKAARKKAAPRIKCSQIRHAWDRSKTVSQNLAEMGLAVDPNKAVPIRKAMKMDVDDQETKTKIVRKPYVINELEYEASLPEKKSETLSKDLIDYVQHMIRNYGENFKKMARDEKNYYQDTPKQIKRKINVYKRFYPEEYQAFIDSLKQEKMDEQ
ncbi:nucleolar protein 16 isoform X1 [Anolis carolinensis]|uniref:Nucleolar protein 16 n=1 Tax=Anolis carolinensis TaxID=28377 RepID=H9GB91_ANOCA|nr:PREDICTED: nucleolar protein 16 [Anolis carolinensis]|eukprot:XP_003227961.1 PREDICTED: nucleolar protein 16 [Anolis carolinensis]